MLNHLETNKSSLVTLPLAWHVLSPRADEQVPSPGYFLTLSAVLKCPPFLGISSHTPRYFSFSLHPLVSPLSTLILLPLIMVF